MLFGIVHIGNVLEVEKLLNTLGVVIKRREITYWPCYDSTVNHNEYRISFKSYSRNIFGGHEISYIVTFFSMETMS
jgi:hypothetical protein